MTQAPLFVAEQTLEARIVEAAREQKVEWITLFDRDPWPLKWRCFLKPHDAGWINDGPWLDDFEAAVLIGAGWPYEVYEYDRWPERTYLDGRASSPVSTSPRPPPQLVAMEGRDERGLA